MEGSALTQPALAKGLDRIAYWGRFFGVLSILSGVLIALAAVAVAAAGNSGPMAEALNMGPLGAAVAVVYAAFAVPYIWSGRQLNRCALGCRKALNNKDEGALAQGLSELGKLFRFWGILTVLFLAVYGLLFLAGIGTAALL